MVPEQLKVLSVCTSDTHGGAARAAWRIHQGVRSLGVDSCMLVKEKQSGEETILALDTFVPNGRLHQLGDWVAKKVKNKLQHTRWNRYPHRDNVFLSDLRGTRLYGVFQKVPYDVLHLHWLNLRFVHLKDLPKDKPIVWTLHDCWPFCGVCHYFFDCEGYKQTCGHCPVLHSNQANDMCHLIWREKKKAYRDLDLHIVAPSRWMARCASESALLGRFPVVVIPNCLDVEAYRPLGDEAIANRWADFVKRRGETAFVLFGAVDATTNKIKGYRQLLEALNRLEREDLGYDFELIVFGADRPLEDMQEAIRTHYVGYVSDVNELVSLYNLASVTVVPSLAENLSCTIMESLSCGTPVVAFDLGGNSDMIDHFQNGYLARKEDTADLATGIRWCLENNKEGALSLASREKALRDYAPAVVALQYKELYEDIARSH